MTDTTVATRSGQGLIVGSRIFMPVSALAMGAMLSRELGTDGRGQVATVLVDLEVAAVVAGLGLPVVLRTAVARHGPGVAGPVWRLARSHAPLLSMAAVVLAVVLFVPTSAARTEAAIGAVVLFAAAPLVWHRLLLEGLTSGLGAYRLHAVIAFAVNGAPLLVITTLFVTGRLGVVAACVAYAVGYVLAFAVTWPSRPRDDATTAGSDRSAFAPDEFRAAWSQSWLQQLAEFLNNRIDLLLITVLATTDVVGIFAVAAAVGRLPGMAVQVATITMASEVRRGGAEAGDDQRVRRYLVRFGVVIAVLSLVGGGVAAVLIPVVYGADFAPAVPLMWILLVGTVASSIGRIASVSVLIDGSTVPTWSAVVGVVVTVIGMLVGWAAAQETGAAIGSTVGFVASAAIALGPLVGGTRG